MNFSLFSLSINNARFPILSVPNHFSGGQNIDISKISITRSFSSFFKSSNYFFNLKIDNSRFSRFLSSAVRIASLSKSYTKSKIVESISFSQQTASININHCSFIKCTTNEQKGGGGILCVGVQGTMNITFSSFLECSSKQAMSNGGALSVTECKLKTEIINSCFDSCTAILSGQAIFFKSTNSETKFDSISISNCPSKMSKMQTAAIDHNTCLDGQNINISSSKSPRTPAFKSRVQDNTYRIEFLSIFNLTCDKFASIYEINVNGNDVITTLKKWNVIKCIGNYKDMGQYKTKPDITHEDAVFAECSQKVHLFIMTGKVIFKNIVSDVPLTFDTGIASYEEINCRQVEEIITFEMSNRFSEACWKPMNKANFTFEISNTVLVFVGIVLLIIIFGTFTLLRTIHYFVSRRKMKYTLLAVPEIIE